MINLCDPKISFLLTSGNDMSNLSSYLYSREYHPLDVKGYYQGKFENSVLAFTNLSSNELRQDALHILKHFDQDCLCLDRSMIPPPCGLAAFPEHP